MAVQLIRLFGDPVLRTPADPVTDIDSRLGRLVDDLLDTMDAEQGAGLAAPQIGVSSRVFVFDCGGRRGHLVNPSWEPIGEEMQEGREGCLSIPGVSLPTVRYARVVARGLDRAGTQVEFDAEGMLARAIQHETDHVDGRLFLQQLTPELRRQAMAAIRGSEWFGAAATGGGTVYSELPTSQGVS